MLVVLLVAVVLMMLEAAPLPVSGGAGCFFGGCVCSQQQIRGRGSAIALDRSCVLGGHVWRGWTATGSAPLDRGATAADEPESADRCGAIIGSGRMTEKLRVCCEKEDLYITVRSGSYVS